MATSGTISAILMASGFSSRFGAGNKLLARLDGKELAGYTLDLVSSLSFFKGSFFVYSDSEVALLARDYPITPIYNPHPEYGQAHSAQLGVLAQKADYYMFFTCDQPFLTKDLVRQIADAKKPQHIVVPYCGQNPCTPSLFSSFYKDEILALKPNTAMRSIKEKYEDKIVKVNVEDANTLVDIDTAQDYCSAISQ